MARNKYAGYCYCCGTFVPVGYGHFERRWGKDGNKWQIKCVKCASGRTVKDTDREVKCARLEATRDNADRCVCCGEIVPEGRQVCPRCEGGGK